MALDFHKSYKQFSQFERAHLSNELNSQSKYVLYGNVLMGYGLGLFYFSRVLSFQCVFFSVFECTTQNFICLRGNKIFSLRTHPSMPDSSYSDSNPY